MFCLKDLVNLEACQRDEQAAFATTLRDLAKQTWQGLQGRGRHKGGSELIPIRQLSGVPLPQDVSSVHSDVLVFRFDGMKAMLGVRKDAVYRVLYLDRNFTTYGH